MSRTNETRHTKWHDKCKYRLDASVCNNKQRWNDDKCRCQCKEQMLKINYNDKINIKDLNQTC